MLSFQVKNVGQLDLNSPVVPQKSLRAARYSGLSTKRPMQWAQIRLCRTETVALNCQNLKPSTLISTFICLNPPSSKILVTQKTPCITTTLIITSTLSGVPGIVTSHLKRICDISPQNRLLKFENRSKIPFDHTNT